LLPKWILRIEELEINEASEVEVAYPPLHEGVDEEGRAAGGLSLHRVEAAVHIDVDLLHPLREGLELHKQTWSPSAPVEPVPKPDSVSAKQPSGVTPTEKRLRLDGHVLRHFTATYDGVAMASGEVGAAALAGLVVATSGPGGSYVGGSRV